VAQGRTIAETLEIARDVAKRLIEAHQERAEEFPFPAAQDHQDYTIVVGA
jgi:predicted RNase H-like HicB family nuclease